MNKPKIKTFFGTLSILILGFMLVPELGLGQDLSSELTEFNQQRIDLNTKGMYVLSGWALTNIAIGAIGYYNNNGTRKYLHQMNAAWNVVNLAIAAGALYQFSQVDPAGFTFAESLKEANSFEKILLLNMGLNVGYMATGGFLWERGLRKGNNRLTGYGQSLLIQGGFLLLFDTSLFFLNRSNNSQLQSMLEQISVQGTQLSIQIPI